MQLGKKILTRLKSRGIVSPLQDSESGYSRYDLKDIGLELLKRKEQAETAIQQYEM